MPALDAGIYTVTVSLSGFKTAVINDVRVHDRHAASGQGDARGRQPRGDDRRPEQQRDRQHADGDDLVDAQRRSDQQDADADAQRAQRGDVPARRQHRRHQPRLELQRPARLVRRDHARRRQQQRQLQQVDRRLLRDGHAAAGRDRGRHGDDGGRRRRRRRARRGVRSTSSRARARTGSPAAPTSTTAHPTLNTNYWFNERNGLPKNDVKLNQYGVRQGGPIVIPGLYDGRGKAFFFFNYEELRLPNNFTRTRIVLNPDGAARHLPLQRRGRRRCREVNVLALGRNAAASSALDPTRAALLSADSHAPWRTTGVDQQPRPIRNTHELRLAEPGNQIEQQPVVRLDYNLTDKHRLSGVYNWQVVDRDPDQLNGDDVRFPGRAELQRSTSSYRPLASGTLRSTLSSNLVNELRGGIRWGPGYFGTVDSNGPQTFAGHGRLRARPRRTPTHRPDQLARSRTARAGAARGAGTSTTR